MELISWSKAPASIKLRKSTSACCRLSSVDPAKRSLTCYYYYYYYYYYAAFNAPCVGHKNDESQAWGHVELRVVVSVIKFFEFLFESVCSDVQVASDDVR